MASSPADAALAERLRAAPLEPLGRFAAASNATLLCRLDGGEELAVYKPRAGERPLWDFPDGTLWLREVAAYEVCRGLGWSLVPVTVRRDDGPYGPGSVQLYVEHDPERHYFWLLEHGDQGVRAALRRMVAFDLVCNNADRKGGHVLLDRDGAVHLVDHGVCFAVEPKLRTVAWDFAGAPVPDDVRAVAGRLAARLEDGGPLRARLEQLLSGPEVDALAARAARVAALERFPEPSGPHPYPWPPL